MRYKEGYYIVCPGGTSEFHIAWSDGEHFYVPGNAEPVDLRLFVMMSQEPFKVSAVDWGALVEPHEIKLNPPHAE